MRKTVIFLVLAILLLWVTPVYARPSISGKGAVLIDAASGQILYEYNKDEKLPASTTKMLTAIIAIESGRLEETVIVCANPPKVDGTKVYLEEGESVKLQDLVAAALIHSANDAALAIAEYLAGSEVEFAKLMNNKAQELGAVNSHFITPHGLSQEGHYTTAYDLALIGRYSMQNKLFQQLVASKILDWQGKAWQTRLININKMLWNYEGATGVKTGYTTEAKNTIVASAEKDEQNYLAVVLGDSGTAIWEDASALLDYGFANFQQIKLAIPQEVVATLDLNEDLKLELIPRRELSLSLPVGSVKTLDSHLHLQPIQGAINPGQVVGEQAFTIDGEEVGRVELLAANGVKAPFRLINLFLYTGAGLFFVQILWRSSRLLKRRKRTNTRRSSVSRYRGY